MSLALQDGERHVVESSIIIEHLQRAGARLMRAPAGISGLASRAGCAPAA